MSYMQVHSAILIEGEISEKWRVKPEEAAKGVKSPYGFKIKRITLLGNVSDEYLSGFSVHVTTPQLNADMRKKLVNVVKHNPGKIALNISLYDPQTKYRIGMSSNKYRVAVTSDLLKDVSSLGLTYSISKKEIK